MFVLGIGEDVDTTELNQIASGPNNVFRVDSFKDLYEKANEAKRGICVLGIICRQYRNTHPSCSFLLYGELVRHNLLFSAMICVNIVTLPLEFITCGDSKRGKSEISNPSLKCITFCLFFSVPTTPTPVPTTPGKSCMAVLIWAVW